MRLWIKLLFSQKKISIGSYLQQHIMDAHKYDSFKSGVKAS